MRLRIVDARRLNPATIMPPYYRVEALTASAPAFRGKPILTAEQIEDVVAYLADACANRKAAMQQRHNATRREFLGLAGGAAVLGALPS